MLKDILRNGDSIVVPGSYDALSALVAAEAGFKAIYLSGFGVAGSLLGKPDIGLVTAEQMVNTIRYVVEASGGVPVIADGDNGYGGVSSVANLVNTYEEAGARIVSSASEALETSSRTAISRF